MQQGLQQWPGEFPAPVLAEAIAGAGLGQQLLLDGRGPCLPAWQQQVHHLLPTLRLPQAGGARDQDPMGRPGARRGHGAGRQILEQRRHGPPLVGGEGQPQPPQVLVAGAPGQVRLQPRQQAYGQGVQALGTSLGPPVLRPWHLHLGGAQQSRRGAHGFLQQAFHGPDIGPPGLGFSAVQPPGRGTGPALGLVGPGDGAADPDLGGQGSQMLRMVLAEGQDPIQIHGQALGQVVGHEPLRGGQPIALQQELALGVHQGPAGLRPGPAQQLAPGRGGRLQAERHAQAAEGAGKGGAGQGGFARFPWGLGLALDQEHPVPCRQAFQDCPGGALLDRRQPDPRQVGPGQGPGQALEPVRPGEAAPARVQFAQQRRHLALGAGPDHGLDERRQQVGPDRFPLGRQPGLPRLGAGARRQLAGRAEEAQLGPDQLAPQGQLHGHGLAPGAGAGRLPVHGLGHRPIGQGGGLRGPHLEPGDGRQGRQQGMLPQHLLHAQQAGPDVRILRAAQQIGPQLREMPAVERPHPGAEPLRPVLQQQLPVQVEVQAAPVRGPEQQVQFLRQGPPDAVVEVRGQFAGFQLRQPGPDARAQGPDQVQAGLGVVRAGAQEGLQQPDRAAQAGGLQDLGQGLGFRQGTAGGQGFALPVQEAPDRGARAQVPGPAQAGPQGPPIRAVRGDRAGLDPQVQQGIGGQQGPPGSGLCRQPAPGAQGHQGGGLRWERGSRFLGPRREPSERSEPCQRHPQGGPGPRGQRDARQGQRDAHQGQGPRDQVQPAPPDAPHLRDRGAGAIVGTEHGYLARDPRDRLARGTPSCPNPRLRGAATSLRDFPRK